MTMLRLVSTGLLLSVIVLSGCRGWAPESLATQQSTKQQPLVQDKDVERSSIERAKPKQEAAQTTEPQRILHYLYTNAEVFELCGRNLNKEDAERGSQVYKLGDRQYLVKLQCFLAAYQGNYAFVLYTKSSPRLHIQPLLLSTFTRDMAGNLVRLESTTVAGLPAFDPKQKVLTLSTKFRGIGDCGSVAKYKLVQNELRLTEFKVKYQCDGLTTPYQQIYP